MFSSQVPTSFANEISNSNFLWPLVALLMLLACTIVLWFFISTLKKNAALRENAAALESENRNLLESLQLERERGDKFVAELEEQRREHILNREKISALDLENERLHDDCLSYEGENNTLHRQNADLKDDLTRAQSELKNISSLREEESAAFAQREKELRETFSEKEKNLQDGFAHQQHELEARLCALGEKMLKERAAELKTVSNEQFKNTVDPLKEELLRFRELIDKARRENYTQAGRLSEELKQMQLAQQTLSKQALDLTEALKSGGKAQGMWGELQLERVLDSSGLTKGVEYEREVAGNRAMGERGRPDAVIRLPENRCIIIDAKCSLTAYTEYNCADSKSEKERALCAHAQSVKDHIDALAGRAYQNYQSLNSPSFVFMFVPLDGALQAACLYDHALYAYAEQKNIYLVSPSSLIPSLKVVSNLWVLARQNEHIRTLALDAQKIADKFDLVRKAYDDVIKRKDSFEEALETFGNRLLSGRGNLGSMLTRFASRSPKVLSELDGKTIDGETLRSDTDDEVKPLLENACEEETAGTACVANEGGSVTLGVGDRGN